MTSAIFKKVDPSRVRLWFRAVEEAKSVVFEPMGDTFVLEPGADLFLDLPAADVKLLEILVWTNGLSVTLPFPGDNKVLDHDGEVVEHLWRGQQSAT